MFNKVIIQLGDTFAQVMTAQLSWPVQNCDLIESAELSWPVQNCDLIESLN